MLFSRSAPLDHRAFAPLPVEMITLDRKGDRMAVHVRGNLASDRLPLICVPGYQRNMSDFTQLADGLPRILGESWPLVLVDLRGRGRSSHRRHKDDYVTPADAHDLLAVLDALAIRDAVFLGQGYGGQTIMALAAQRPAAIAASILIDAGPLSNPRGLVRLRSNLEVMRGATSRQGALVVMAQIAATDYPGASTAEIETQLDRLYGFDKRGRPHPLFDKALIKRLEGFAPDDVLVTQWSLFGALSAVPMMLLRTQLSDQLRRETFEEMVRRRRDATSLIIAGQGSPALLNHPDEMAAIGKFMNFAQERALKRRGP